MQLFKEDEEKLPETPEQTAVTSGDEDGEGTKDEEAAEEEQEEEDEQEPLEKEAEEKTPSTTPNGPVAGDTPKSILKKKDLEETKEGESPEEGEDNTQ